MTTVDVISHNAQAWDNQVKTASQWTVPVEHEEIEAARAGLFSILLTAKKPVPRDWFPKNLAGVKILCLASGGGQQAPILAAAGADVTVFDNSEPGSAGRPAGTSALEDCPGRYAGSVRLC
mgnify:CR=1 FL=1